MKLVTFEQAATNTKVAINPEMVASIEPVDDETSIIWTQKTAYSVKGKFYATLARLEGLPYK